MEKIKEIWHTTVDELINKVTWPTWEELRSSMVIVLIASLIFALTIYVIDLGFGFITNTIYDLLKG
jgi:preprotein translocase subunit SecE